MRGTSEYYYNVGEVVENKLILEQIRMKKGSQSKEKGYTYKCLRDGYIGEKSEVQLRKGGGCPICYGRTIMKGINDITTTHPHLVKYFVKIEDCYTLGYGSGKKARLKCPICGTEKIMTVNTFVKYGLACATCSDGISYPEKFVSSLLTQLNIKFKTQYNHSWSEGRRYDFYLYEKNIIIETHGEQHYKRKKHYMQRTLKDEQLNDLLKEVLAVGNLGCCYVQLDCRKSELNWIKESVINSNLLTLLGATKEEVNWEECDKNAIHSKIKEACDLWNSGIKSTKEIASIINVHRGTVNSYLKQCDKMGMCNYYPTMGDKKVKVIETGKIYNSAHELERRSEEELGVKLSFSSICRVCRGERKSYKGFHMEYVVQQEV